LKRDATNYAMVGGFVVAMAVALLVALFQLTGRGKPTDTYFADFRNIAGIKQGSVVTFEGHEIGRVGAIGVDQASGRTMYHLALKVQRGWQIPAGSKVRRTSSTILAPLVVDIEAGPSRTLLQPGATLEAQEGPNMMEAIADVAGRLSDLTERELEPLLKRLGERVDRVSDQVESALPEELKVLNQTLGQMNNASRLLERALRDENQRHLTRALANAEMTTENVLEISENLKKTRASLDRLLNQSNALVDANGRDIRKSVREIREALRRIDGILHQFEDTGRNMAEFSREIRENPSSLIRSSPPVDKSGPQGK
jgi:phospholipid/cholesterol/gamma-HCH transport system substrate-binding protein